MRNARRALGTGRTLVPSLLQYSLVTLSLAHYSDAPTYADSSLVVLWRHSCVDIVSISDSRPITVTS